MDLSRKPTQKICVNFLNFSLKDFKKDPTCYKNLNNPSCIDLMFPNKARRFQRSCVTETGLYESAFNKMTITVLKMQFCKLEPKVVCYRNYKNFSNDIFLKSLNNELSKYSFSPDENGFDRFCQISTDRLTKYAPSKKKTIRGNHSPFINKKISKAIMKRTQLRNICFKLRAIESKLAYTKQRNYCVTVIRKGKKEYYGSTDVKDITDNKKFWKTVKALFSDKSKSRRTITLAEDVKIESNHKKNSWHFE